MSPLVLDGDDPRTYTVRISFPQAQFNTGILENGNYQVPLPANSISSASDGQPLAEEYTLTLWFLNGDADRSRGIDAADYAIIDASYSVTGLTDTSGVVQERFVYDPYGKVTVLDTNWATDSDGQSDFNWAYLHQSGRKDGTTGLSHFRFREQSASLGRWTTNDPMGYADGANRYEFVSSAPVSWVDPRGLTGVSMGLPVSTYDPGSVGVGAFSTGTGSGVVVPPARTPSPTTQPRRPVTPTKPNGLEEQVNIAADVLQATVLPLEQGASSIFVGFAGVVGVVFITPAEGVVSALELAGVDFGREQSFWMDIIDATGDAWYHIWHHDLLPIF